MHCVSCKKHINPLKSTRGAFYCQQNHWQCVKCTAGTGDNCRVCAASTFYVKMTVERSENSQETPISVNIGSNEVKNESACSSIVSNKDNAIVPSSSDEKSSERSVKVDMCDPFDSISGDPRLGVIDVVNRAPEYSATHLIGDFESGESVTSGSMSAIHIETMDKPQTYDAGSLKDDDKSVSISFVKPVAIEPKETQETFKTIMQGSQDMSILGDAKDTSLTNNEDRKPACEQTTSPCCHQNSCDPVKRVVAKHDVGVSTASKPCLADLAMASRKGELPDKHPRQDYQVMQAGTDTAMPAGTVFWPSQKLNAQPSMDQRLDKVLGTMQEDAGPREVPEKVSVPQLGSKLKKSRALPSQFKGIQSGVNEAASTSKGVGSIKRPHVYRAAYKPLSGHANAPPLQCDMVTNPFGNLLSDDEEQMAHEKPCKGEMTEAPGLHVICPDTFCGQAMFVSDVTVHVLRNHTTTAVERIAPGEHKNFFIDPDVAKLGFMNINLMFLLCDKVKGVGRGKFKDMLPLLVMTTRVSPEELSGLERNANSTKDFLLVWITGSNPTPSPLRVCLTAVGRSSRDPPLTTLTFGDVYSIRKRQAPKSILEKCNLVLSKGELKSLTNNGENPLELQFLID